MHHCNKPVWEREKGKMAIISTITSDNHRVDLRAVECKKISPKITEN